jgi:hypothetical protein
VRRVTEGKQDVKAFQDLQDHLDNVEKMDCRDFQVKRENL